VATKSEEGKKIIVVRKRGRHAEHHGGAWKVAYADFVTSMMAFFLVMWIVTQSDPVRQSVAGYFQDPVGFSEKVRAGLLEGGDAILDSAPEQQEMPEEQHSIEEEQAREKLRESAGEILRRIQQSEGFGDLARQIELEITEEGLRIELMEGSEATFFDLGNAKPSGPGAAALSTIGQVLAPLGYDVAIEGHTDSKPYANRESYTNWELSSDRANTARRILEKNGVRDQALVAIRGYADKRLRFADHPEDSRNRRITILVLNPYAPGAERGAAGDLEHLGASRDH
jgi:chemotaxis protein MotB